VGVLDPLFQLLRTGRLCAQPALYPVSRGMGTGVPAPSFLATPAACPRTLCPLIPLIQLECGWGWWRQMVDWPTWEGVPRGSDHTQTTVLPAGFRGKNCAGGTAMSTACASCR
jgi:hypothetical protein